MPSQSTQQLLNEAIAAHRIGDFAKAARAYESILHAEPGNADALHGLGLIAHQFNQHQQAITLLSKATELSPNTAHFHANLGLAHKAAGQLDAALASLRTAIRLQPGRASHHANLGLILHSQQAFTEATLAYRLALSIDPMLADTHSDLAMALQTQGLVEEAVVHLNQAIVLRPSSVTESNLLLAMHYSEATTPEERFAAHAAWAKRYAKDFAPSIRSTPNEHSKLRIGFVSPDLRSHPVASFLEPFLRHHDRTRFEITCYSNTNRADTTTARLKTLVHQWRPTHGKSDDALAAQIRSDEIDILIDLAGHTAGSRLLVFSRRPAPLQATWIGYPNTTGVRAIDLRMTDAIADPPGIADALHAERLVRLPGCFLCWQPPPDAPPVAPLPALVNGCITFGSFNNLAKLSRPTLQTWAAILTRVPSAHLLLKAPGMTAAAERRVRDLLSDASIAPDRLIFRRAEGSYTAHLARYSEMDIALDPFPYNGTTTVCDALWMGTPIIALRGESHVSRVAASLLTAVGMEPNIAESVDDYVARAAQLASDPQALSRDRMTQRDRIAASPLLDGVTFSRQLEAVIHEELTRLANR